MGKICILYSSVLPFPVQTKYSFLGFRLLDKTLKIQMKIRRQISRKPSRKEEYPKLFFKKGGLSEPDFELGFVTLL